MAKAETFLDQVKILVKAGDGGDGHVGFFRAKYIPNGGPDGGDGGKGGDVVLVGSIHKSTLQDFRFKKHFRAKNGQKGGRAQRTGADGEPIVLGIPLGTIVYDAESGELIGEVTKEGEELLVEEGGKGGLGNLHFATSTNRAPQKATPGKTCAERWIRLELRLLADVGIVGLPNAGKSTLLAALSDAKPKVGAYPFTTLAPTLGVVRYEEKNWTMADMPGLIEGAHNGVGLGIQFLRHIQRTRILLYLVGANPDQLEAPWKDFQTTRYEIEHYDADLLKRPFVVTLNKVDLLKKSQLEKTLQYFYNKGIEPLVISAKTKKDLETLVQALYAKL